MILALLACAAPSLEGGIEADAAGVVATVRDRESAPGRVPELEGRRTLLVLREPARSPVAGRYVREGDTLRFTPVVPFSPGERYRIELHEAGAELRVQTLEIPAEAPSVPAVAAVFPSVARVPANQLKFTARFATPMHVRRDGMGPWGLVDVGTGERVPAAFREQPLWNLDRNAVTLLVHPGRVKRDIPFADGLGAVLVEGRTYEIRVGPGVESASGGQLPSGVVKRFTVGPADHERPRPEDWTVEAPRAPGAPVVLRFDEPMDQATTVAAFAVTGEHGSTVAGQFALREAERELAFQPDSSWLPGSYTLAIVDRVEDLAGNTPDRLFDGPADTVLRKGPIRDRFEFVVAE